MNTEVNNAYARRMAIWKTLLLVALVAFFADKVSAQAPPFIVQHNSQAAFSANCLVHADQSPIYNFLDSCAPPVNPPHDPDAMQSAVATYLLHEPPCVATVTGLEDLGALMKGGPNLPRIGYPFRPTVVNITIPAGHWIYGPTFTLPTNPGTLPHYLKGDLWGGNGTCYKASPTGVVAHLDVVAIQGSRMPIGKCGGDVAFGSPWITIQPLADTTTTQQLQQIMTEQAKTLALAASKVAGTASKSGAEIDMNNTYCNVFYPAGAGTLGQYRIKLDSISNTALSADLNYR